MFNWIHGVLLTLVILVTSHSAIAQSPPLTSRQTEILREVIRVDGSLTKPQYDEFWADFHGQSTEVQQRFRESFRSEAPAILEYQRALWLAAKESIKSQKPIVTPALRSEFERAERSDRDNPARQGRAKKMKQQARELLEAAAYNKPAVRNGRTYQITPEVVEQVLAGLDGSLARLNRLLATSWRASDVTTTGR